MSPRWNRRPTLLALVALVALAACARTAAPPNVVVVLVDTLRPDRLGVYGNRHGLTPAIDALAGQGTVFRNAYAQSSWTMPSVASLFTSRFPSQHQVLSPFSKLDDREETLAKALHARGYATAAFVANVLLEKQLGFAQGFDHWQYVVRPDPAAPPGELTIRSGLGEKVNRAAFAWLDGHAHRTQPVFLYVHYMETHSPYDPPEDVLTAQLGGAPLPNRTQVNSYMQLDAQPMPDSLLPDAWALYNAEVLSVDTEIGRLLDGLRARGLLDSAVVVLLADHGEEFKEHGLMGHGRTLYEEVIRVPLIIATTERPAHREVDGVVSVIDVAPTILELVGGAALPQFEGRSLARAVGERRWWSTLPTRTDFALPVFSEVSPLSAVLLAQEGPPEEGSVRAPGPDERAVVSSGTKLITGVAGESVYYDLRVDPGETHPDGVAPEQRSVLDNALAHLRAIAARGAPPTALAIDDETREHLRALGYAN